MFLNESTLNFDGSENQIFTEGVSSLLEANLEAEMAWGNLMEDVYMRESMALKLEDAEIMNEEDKNTFQKVLDWIKERIASLKAAIQRTILQVSAKCTNINKFVASYKNKKPGTTSATINGPAINKANKCKELSSLDANGDLKKIANNVVNAVNNAANKFKAAKNEEELKKVKEEFSVESSIYNSKESVAIKIDYAKALNELDTARTVVDTLCKKSYSIHNGLLTFHYQKLKAANKKAGMSKSDSSLDIKKTKASDHAVSSLYAKGIAACYVRMGTLIKGVRACAGGKKNDKDAND